MQFQKDKPTQIPMFEVESANLKAIGYDKATLTLRVKFKSSTTAYDYVGVSPELFLEFMKSDSKGQFFFTKIKGRFEFDKTEIKK